LDQRDAGVRRRRRRRADLHGADVHAGRRRSSAGDRRRQVDRARRRGRRADRVRPGVARPGRRRLRDRAVIAIVAATALELVGPSPTAFASTCAQLRHDTPALTCTLVKTLRAGGHPIEIWATLDGDEDQLDVQIFVAIETHEGWYLTHAFAYEPEH